MRDVVEVRRREGGGRVCGDPIAPERAGRERILHVAKRPPLEERKQRGSLRRGCLVAVVLRPHELRNRFAADPKRAALVAEQIAPAAQRHAARGVACVCDRTGAGDDHDAGSAAERSRVRDRRVVHDQAADRSKRGGYAARGVPVSADARHDGFKTRIVREVRRRKRGAERRFYGFAQPRRRGRLADFVGRAGIAAAEHVPALVADHGGRAALPAVDTGEVSRHV